MGKKLITVILLAILMVLISGCTSTTKTTSNASENIATNETVQATSSASDNVATNETVEPNNTTEHPNLMANFTETNVTNIPIVKATAPKTLGAQNGLTAPAKANKVYSYNWAGYSVTGAKGTVTDVKGSWIVPTVQTKAANQYSSNWIGIDGYNSNTVEQIGTDSDTDAKGRATYYAWYEFYPQPCYYVPLTIHPGDKITTEVSYSNGKITLLINDVTTKKSFSITQDAKGYSRSSAEWIVEAPWYNGVLPLTNFGTTSLGKVYTSASNTCFATINGKTNSINSFGSAVNYITMVNDKGQIKAQPGDLSSDGTSFQTIWKRAS